MVKLLMAEKAESNGVIVAFSAVWISHEDGLASGVKSEKVKWYVGAYFMERVVRRARLVNTSAD